MNCTRKSVKGKYLSFHIRDRLNFNSQIYKSHLGGKSSHVRENLVELTSLNPQFKM